MENQSVVSEISKLQVQLEMRSSKEKTHALVYAVVIEDETRPEFCNELGIAAIELTHENAEQFIKDRVNTAVYDAKIVPIRNNDTQLALLVNELHTAEISISRDPLNEWLKRLQMSYFHAFCRMDNQLFGEFLKSVEFIASLAHKEVREETNVTVPTHAITTKELTPEFLAISVLSILLYKNDEHTVVFSFDSEASEQAQRDALFAAWNNALNGVEDALSKFDLVEQKHIKNIVLSCKERPDFKREIAFVKPCDVIEYAKGKSNHFYISTCEKSRFPFKTEYEQTDSSALKDVVYLSIE